MNYERYEDAIVELLEMDGVSVSALPHVSSLNIPRATSEPQLFVLVNGGTFEEPENLSVISQLETIQCEIFIRAKRRRGEKGIFAICDEISKRLLGHKLSGTKHAITLNQFGYVDGIQNTWQYALTFSFTAYKVECDRSTDEPIITIKKITTNIDPL